MYGPSLSFDDFSDCLENVKVGSCIVDMLTTSAVYLKSASFVSFTDKNFKCLTEIKILSVRMSDTKIQDILHRTRTCLTENYTVWHDVSFYQT